MVQTALKTSAPYKLSASQCKAARKTPMPCKRGLCPWMAISRILTLWIGRVCLRVHNMCSEAYLPRSPSSLEGLFAHTQTQRRQRLSKFVEQTRGALLDGDLPVASRDLVDAVDKHARHLRDFLLRLLNQFLSTTSFDMLLFVIILVAIML